MARTTQMLPITLMLPVGAIEAHALASLDSGKGLVESLVRALSVASRVARTDHASLAKMRLQALASGAGPAVSFRLMLPARAVTTLLTMAAAADLGVAEVATAWLLQARIAEGSFRRLGGGHAHGRMAADNRP